MMTAQDMLNRPWLSLNPTPEFMEKVIKADDERYSWATGKDDRVQVTLTWYVYDGENYVIVRDREDNPTQIWGVL